jgi:hypothetical protein
MTSAIAAAHYQSEPQPNQSRPAQLEIPYHHIPIIRSGSHLYHARGCTRS